MVKAYEDVTRERNDLTQISENKRKIGWYVQFVVQQLVDW